MALSSGKNQFNLFEMRKIGFVIASFLILCSCSNEKVYFEKNIALDADYTWNQTNIVSFDIPIQENSHPHQLSLNFRYATGYRYDKLSIRITTITPEGVKVISDYDIPVRDSNGEFIGEKGYDIIDLNYVLDPAIQFPVHGDYRYTIEQRMPDATLDYVLEIGLKVSDPDPQQ
jgi:gliding motility-associated lipoprotein GldH